MNCISCQAALAPRSSHCYFCGTAQPQAQAGGAAWQGSSGGSTTYAQWIASSAPNGESWRAWASFFLGGLYGPIASRFLYEREEWSAGVRQANHPPVAPSTRGLVVLGMFFGLPMLAILVLGYTISANDVSWNPTTGARYGVSEAHTFAYLNVFVAMFYAGSLLAARHVDRRFQVLLYELTGGEKTALGAFRAGKVRRTIASVVALCPLALLLSANVTMLRSGWSYTIPASAVYYLFAVTAATWATSWLHVNGLARFRRAMLARP